MTTPTPTDALRLAKEALEFYFKEWQQNAEGDFSTPGLSRSWTEPTEELWKDEGRRAGQALEAIADIEGEK